MAQKLHFFKEDEAAHVVDQVAKAPCEGRPGLADGANLDPFAPIFPRCEHVLHMGAHPGARC